MSAGSGRAIGRSHEWAIAARHAGTNGAENLVGNGLLPGGEVGCGARGVRLNRQTPCLSTGVCGDCHSADCICSNIVITRNNPIPGRIKIILIGEACGY